MHNGQPKISVIMSVYNSEKYLKEAVKSILDQTFTDFEFIITDDRSTDNSLSILEKYEKTDDRIVLVKNSENVGLTINLNRMIDLAKGDYIARMDADDISLPMRLKTQYDFMEINPEIGVLGTHSKTFGLGVKEKILPRPISHEEIKANLLFENPMVHSSIFFRRSVINSQDTFYNEEFKIMQDYELWTRIINKTKFANLGEVLLEYRTSDTNICAVSEKKENFRQNYLRNIYRSLFNEIDFKVQDNEIDTHVVITYNRKNNDLEKLLSGEIWLKELSRRNNDLKSFDKIIFDELVSRYWFYLCTKSSSTGTKVIFKYFRSECNTNYKPSIYMLAKFIIKCLIKY